MRHALYHVEISGGKSSAYLARIIICGGQPTGISVHCPSWAHLLPVTEGGGIEGLVDLSETRTEELPRSLQLRYYAPKVF